MSPGKSVDVVINAHSGFQNVDEVRVRLEELFAKTYLVAKLHVARSIKQLEELIHRAVNSHSRVVAVGGGDGTISTVASAIIESSREKTLAVLPLGTLNHFAQDLGVPLDLEAAVRIIAEDHEELIDVAEVNGRIFINNSSLGLYPQIVQERLKQQRLGHGKWPAFAWAALSVFRRQPFVEVRLIGGGKSLFCKTPFVFIGNNEYAMEGFKIGRRDRLNAGVISLYVTRRIGRWGLVRLALRALLGHLAYEKDFEAFTTDHITIQSRRPRMRVAFDGEIGVVETPLHYRIRKQALSVIVPRPQ